MYSPTTSSRPMRAGTRKSLAIELQSLVDLDFDITLTGFSLVEVDFVLDGASDADPGAADGPEDATVVPAERAVSRRGDVWQLGRHRLLCGDARQPEDYRALLRDERVDLVFTDPPHNVPIDGHVCGSPARSPASAAGARADAARPAPAPVDRALQKRLRVS